MGMSPEQAPPMTQHPDLLELRDRFERVAETPTAQLVDGLTVLAGLYVALSPWIVGFTGGQARLAINDLIIGLAIALLGVGFAWAYPRTHRISWVCPLLGVWTIVAVWVMRAVGASTGTVASNVISGVVVVLLGLVAMATGLGRSTRARA
jgi:hypothetical protein